MIQDQVKIILKHFNDGHYNKVIQTTNTLLKIYPKNSYLKNLIGSAFIQTGDIENAIINFESSIKLLPNNVAALNNLGNSHKKISNYKLAKSYYLRALKISPGYINSLVGYGNLKVLMQDSEGAIELFNKAISLNPNVYLAHFNLATTYLTLNIKDLAIKHAQITLEIKPDFSAADKLVSTLRKYKEHDPHFIKMKEGLNNSKIAQPNAIFLHFGLAKAYNDIGKPKKFIDHIISGNFLRKKLTKYDVNKDIDLMRKIQSLFKNINYSKVKPYKNDKKIIFVVGMPRSGTSLIEQILSSHSAIFGAGELPFLNKLFLKEFDKIHSIDSSFSVLSEITNSYIDKISSYSSNQNYILDKNPFNFFWIGFIKILFPKAKIIHVKRSPKDTCYSCFKQLFENINFADDMDDLSMFYNSYNKLMKFWNLTLKDTILNIDYENLIEDPKFNINKMLNYCDLNFEENCLNFNDNKNAVRTLSVSQVRLPLYKGSINSYKKHEKDLSKLFNNLK